MLGMSASTLLQLPIERSRLSPRVIRFSRAALDAYTNSTRECPPTRTKLSPVTVSPHSPVAKQIDARDWARELLG